MKIENWKKFLVHHIYIHNNAHKDYSKEKGMISELPHHFGSHGGGAPMGPVRWDQVCRQTRPSLSLFPSVHREITNRDFHSLSEDEDPAAAAAVTSDLASSWLLLDLSTAAATAATETRSPTTFAAVEAAASPALPKSKVVCDWGGVWPAAATGVFVRRVIFDFESRRFVFNLAVESRARFV